MSLNCNLIVIGHLEVIGVYQDLHRSIKRIGVVDTCVNIAGNFWIVKMN